MEFHMVVANYLLAVGTFLLFGGAVWYALETQQIRETHSDELATLQEQTDVLQTQTEVLQKQLQASIYPDLLVGIRGSEVPTSKEYGIEMGLEEDTIDKIMDRLENTPLPDGEDTVPFVIGLSNRSSALARQVDVFIWDQDESHFRVGYTGLETLKPNNEMIVVADNETFTLEELTSIFEESSRFGDVEMDHIVRNVDTADESYVGAITRDKHNGIHLFKRTFEFQSDREGYVDPTDIKFLESELVRPNII